MKEYILLSQRGTFLPFPAQVSVLFAHIIAEKTWQQLVTLHLQSGITVLDADALPAASPLIQSRTPARRMMSLTFRVGFPMSFNPVLKL